MSSANKGFNITKLDFLPSEFFYYKFKKLRLQDLSLSQVTNLSILNGEPDLAKMIEIYAPSFTDLTRDQVEKLLYIDFIACAHFINHLTFGVYNNSFSCECPTCGAKSKVEYNLYNLDFVASKVKEKKIQYNSIEVTLRNFTVDLMAKLIAEGLQEDKNAFIASCMEKTTIEGKLSEDFEDFEKARESLPKYPYSFKEKLSREIALRYPKVLPITTFLSCSHKLEFTPDLTLKGLPTLTPS